MLEPNFWTANAPRPTLFMPVGEVSEPLLGILPIFLANGYVIRDDLARRSAGLRRRRKSRSGECAPSLHGARSDPDGHRSS